MTSNGLRYSLSFTGSGTLPDEGGSKGAGTQNICRLPAGWRNGPQKCNRLNSSRPMPFPNSPLSLLLFPAYTAGDR